MLLNVTKEIHVNMDNFLNAAYMGMPSISFYCMLHVVKVLGTRPIPRITHGSSKPVALTVLHLLFLWYSLFQLWSS